MSESYEPIIVGFLCNWCSYRAADLAGTARLRYAPNMRPIRVMCSGRVEPDMVLKALANGADGVLITILQGPAFSTDTLAFHQYQATFGLYRFSLGATIGLHLARSTVLSGG